MELVELVQTVGEQAEGAADDDLLGLALLELLGRIQHTLAGGDHVVDDEHSLSLHGGAEELVGDDGVSSADDLGVIAALVEHPHVHAQIVGQVHSAVHGALVGADDHQVFLVDLKVGVVVEQRLHKLVSGHKVVKSDQGNGILHSGVVGVKGNDVVHAHVYQFLQGHRTV